MMCEAEGDECCDGVDGVDGAIWANMRNGGEGLKLCLVMVLAVMGGKG